MKIIISYDEKNGYHISFDQIESRIQLDNSSVFTDCTSIISKHSKLQQQLYNCKTCDINGICEICAKVCHSCNCSTENHQCKCLSTQVCSDDDEIYEELSLKKQHQSIW